MNKTFSRRRLIKAAGASAAVATAGFPAILKAQGGGTIKIGVPTILSGRVALLGTSSVGGLKTVFDKVNAAGGIGGKKIETVVRDSKGQPQEAAKVTRDLINNDGCQIIIDAEASSGAFAVHEVIREVGVLCIHTNSETTSLTADPKLHVPTAFRTARQGIHDAIGGGEYAARIAKAKNLKKWVTCSPDYAYGRSNTAEFMEYAKHFDGSIQVVEESWPKLFQPDYTEVVTKVLNAKADAMYSALWGGDLVSFIDQGNLYGLFDKLTCFMVNLGDYGVVDEVKQFPEGVHSGGRYNRTVPATPENEAWYQDYVKINKSKPTNWSWENAVAAQMLVEALTKTAGDTNGKKLAEVIKGMTIKSPWGADGTLTMRAEDNTLINYIIGYGLSQPKEPFISAFQSSNWQAILELEKQWKKKQGYA
ncbi:ABC transporter substrate-binding protein [Reyranella sp. CPCC 100927]|uniref:ABC transporter substrate-binding protein n=1 Tax=Reyranella sp. CPCC 100927 TaxID=2599616 RepID=UPI0011B53E7D|nr:ABC transporter substrate-binding protein [Reyranella sp. CPCC 100927]TWT13931.1 ABC transporter substrate-binding protein [Reyranella sp. CPCC 100927]